LSAYGSACRFGGSVCKGASMAMELLFRRGGSDHGWSREVAGGADLRVSTETLDSDAGVKTGSYVSPI
jgi:hypothetical protein